MTPLLPLLLALNTLPGYQPAATEGGYLYWEHTPVLYRVNRRGDPDTPDYAGGKDVQGNPGPDLAAVRAACSAWNGVSCTYFSFQFDGFVDATDVGYSEGENQNLVVWQDDPTYWVTPPNSPQMLALTTLSFSKSSGALKDADIEMNGAFFTWTTADTNVRADVRNTVTHEAGHVLGLDHSGDAGSVMYNRASAGETSKRTLTADDRAGLCFLYPVSGTPPWEGQGSGTSACSVGTAGEPTTVFWLLGLLISLLLAPRFARSRRP
jgi:hypothetical protein